ncbi:putative polysaccharide biosynthesis protein [Lacticaseibacillus absianus]|uniref:putative polysaccharide biosynthesis protein n=1 Tax=Lacticaseibacillus absianus TaxID=2729623 RepID=UPI0015CA8465|nr:polysaccharide biosynthesis protein [Lacticaseibacillus absianus]
MQNTEMKTLMKGAWILSLAGLIAKVLSAVYRVPFQNLVGDTGFYVYQQVYPLYGIGMTFALSGFPVFISKLIAEAREPETQAEITHRALVMMTWLGGGMFAILEVGAPVIARLMADAALAPLIRSVGLMFLTMPVLATARGYFQGTFDMTKTAISQVVEQIVRVGVILVAAWLAVQRGWDPYHMGTWAMSGAFFGGLAAVATVWWAYAKVFRGKHFAFAGFSTYLNLFRRFLNEGGSIALFATMLIMLQLVDSFTVTRGLAAQGVAPAAAKALKGVYDRGQPLVQLGLVVATSLSTTLLPSLTRSVAKGQMHSFLTTARQLIRFNLSLSLAATSGLIALMPAINWLLFGDTADSTTLRIYALSIVLVALINAYNAILQSLNQFRATTYALFVGFALKLLANQPLVMLYGTAGAAWATVLSLTVILVLLYLQLPEAIRQPDPRQFGLRLLLVITGMSLPVHALATHMALTSRTDVLKLVGAGVGMGVALYIVLAAVVQLYTVREVLSIPLGRRFMKRWLRLTTKKGH